MALPLPAAPSSSDAQPQSAKSKQQAGQEAPPPCRKDAKPPVQLAAWVLADAAAPQPVHAASKDDSARLLRGGALLLHDYVYAPGISPAMN